MVIKYLRTFDLGKMDNIIFQQSSKEGGRGQKELYCPPQIRTCMEPNKNNGQTFKLVERWQELSGIKPPPPPPPPHTHTLLLTVVHINSTIELVIGLIRYIIHILQRATISGHARLSLPLVLSVEAEQDPQGEKSQPVYTGTRLTAGNGSNI